MPTLTRHVGVRTRTSGFTGHLFYALGHRIVAREANVRYAPGPAQKSLQNLKSITLALKSAGTQVAPFPPADRCEHLRKLLSYMPNLMRLRLNGDLLMHTAMRNPNDDQIACIADLVKVAPIARLELGKISFSQAAFRKVVDAIQLQGKVHNITLFRVSAISILCSDTLGFQDYLSLINRPCSRLEILLHHGNLGCLSC